MKIVINACHGGFRLSAMGLKHYANRKRIQCHFYRYSTSDHGGEIVLTPCLMEVANQDVLFLAYTCDNAHRLPSEERRKYHFTDCEIERDDPDLVYIVEAYGDHISGPASCLKVIEIPDGIEWQVEEYDGREWVAEVHRTWS